MNISMNSYLSAHGLWPQKKQIALKKTSLSWLNHWKALAVQLIVPLAGSVGSLANDVHEQGLLVSLDVVGRGDWAAVGAGIQTLSREWLQDNDHLRLDIFGNLRNLNTF